MAAEKVTMKQFGEKLNSYNNGGAARKAVGRFNGWSDEEKNKARKLIDAKFGSADTAKPAKATKKAVKAKPAKVAAKALKAARKGASPKAPRAPRNALVPVGAQLTVGEATGQLPPSMFASVGEVMIKRFIAERAITQCAIVSDTAAKLHTISAAVDLTPTIRIIIDLQNKALMVFSKELDGVELTEEKVTVRRGRKPAEVSRDNGKGTLEAAVGDDDALPAPAPAAPIQI